VTGQLFSPRALWAIDSSKNPLPDGTYVLEVADGKVVGWTTESGGGGGGGITGLTSADATVDIADNGDGTLDLSAPGGSSGPKSAIFYVAVVAVGTGALRLHNDTGATWTLLSIRAEVVTAPSGGSVVVDVNKNGTTVFTTQANRPTITTGNTTSGKVTSMDVTSVADGDYLTVDVDTATSPAARLQVTVVYQ
jgi:hypothetical protein